VTYLGLLFASWIVLGGAAAFHRIEFGRNADDSVMVFFRPFSPYSGAE
jgi:hypothetical protein